MNPNYLIPNTINNTAFQHIPNDITIDGLINLPQLNKGYILSIDTDGNINTTGNILTTTLTSNLVEIQTDYTGIVEMYSEIQTIYTAMQTLYINEQALNNESDSTLTQIQGYVSDVILIYDSIIAVKTAVETIETAIQAYNAESLGYTELVQEDLALVESDLAIIEGLVEEATASALEASTSAVEATASAVEATASAVEASASAIVSTASAVESTTASAVSIAMSVVSTTASVVSTTASVVSTTASTVSVTASVLAGTEAIASGASAIASGASAIASGVSATASITASVLAGTEAVASGASALASGASAIASGISASTSVASSTIAVTASIEAGASALIGAGSATTALTASTAAISASTGAITASIEAGTSAVLSVSQATLATTQATLAIAQTTACTTILGTVTGLETSIIAVSTTGEATLGGIITAGETSIGTTITAGETLLGTTITAGETSLGATITAGTVTLTTLLTGLTAEITAGTATITALTATGVATITGATASGVASIEAITAVSWASLTAYAIVGGLRGPKGDTGDASSVAGPTGPAGNGFINNFASPMGISDNVMTGYNFGISGQTASKVCVFDVNHNITSSTVSITTLGYLDLTSSGQSQIDSKLSTAIATTTYQPLSTALLLVGGTLTGNLNGITPTQLGYLTTLTSNVQTQLSLLLSTVTATATYQPISSMSSYLTTSTASTTYQPLSTATTIELNYVHGTTSNIQSQIDFINASLTSYLPILSNTNAGGSSSSYVYDISPIFATTGSFQFTLSSSNSSMIYTYYLQTSQLGTKIWNNLYLMNVSQNHPLYVNSSNIVSACSVAYNDIQSISGMSAYQPISSMSSYLTTSSATSTYQPISSMSSYLTTSIAISTYQPISSMSSYLTTSTATSTYQPIASMSSYLLLSGGTIIGTTNINITAHNGDVNIGNINNWVTINSGAWAIDGFTGNITTVGTLHLSNQSASKIAIFDSSKNIVSSSISTTTLGYLDVSSSIQGQFNNIATTYQPIANMSNYLTTSSASSTYQTISGLSGYGYLTSTSASSTYQPLSTTLLLTGGTLTGNLNGVTTTQLGYLTTLTSNVQTQFNNINLILTNNKSRWNTNEYIGTATYYPIVSFNKTSAGQNVSFTLEGYFGHYPSQAMTDLIFNIRDNLVVMGELYVDGLSSISNLFQFWTNNSSGLTYLFLYASVNYLITDFVLDYGGLSNSTVAAFTPFSSGLTSMTGYTLVNGTILTGITHIYDNAITTNTFKDKINSQALTASTVLLSDSSKNIMSSSISATTLSYLDITSSGQTQLNSKLNLSGGTLTGTLYATNIVASGYIEDAFNKNWVITSSGNTGIPFYYKLATIGYYDYGHSGNIMIRGSIVLGPGNAYSGICNFSITFQPDFLSSTPFITGYAYTYADSGIAVGSSTGGELIYTYTTTVISSTTYYGFEVYYMYNGTNSGNTASFTVSKTGDYYGSSLTLNDPLTTGMSSTAPANQTYILQNINTNGISIYNGKLLSRNNTLDDGSGNMTTKSLNLTNTSGQVLTFTGSGGIYFDCYGNIYPVPSSGATYWCVLDSSNNQILKVGLNGATKSVSTLNNILDDGSGNLITSGTISGAGTLLTTNASVQGFHIGWNYYNASTGETDFVNNKGYGTGGFNFYNVSGSPSSLGSGSLILQILPSGGITSNGNFNNGSNTLTTGAITATGLNGITSTQLGYLTTLTSNVQTQLEAQSTRINNKLGYEAGDATLYNSCYVSKYSYYVTAHTATTDTLTVYTYTQMVVGSYDCSYIPYTSLGGTFFEPYSNAWTIKYVSGYTPRFFKVDMTISLNSYGGGNEVGLKFYTSTSSALIPYMTLRKTAFGYGWTSPTASISCIIDINYTDTHLAFGVYANEGSKYVKEYTLSITPLGTSTF